jgi:mannose-1-phosphate guanylyltransferase
VQRAAAVAPKERICTVVAAQHRRWWTGMLGQLPDLNVIVQPHSRGTAHGILYPLLKIAARDPDAIVVLLPADHYIRNENIMAESLRRAAALADAQRGAIYLLGAEPDEPDTELGYIVPASRSREAPARVLRFTEKPTALRAQALLGQGALWNVFIVAGSARALLGMYGGSFAATMMSMRALEGSALADMYEQLRSLDFSRDVLQGSEALLQVLPVPNCGWTDLGTPARVAQTLRQLQELGQLPRDRSSSLGRASMGTDGYLSLAEQFSLQQPWRLPVVRPVGAGLHV